MQVVRKGNTIQVGDWTITCNLTEKGKAAIYVIKREGEQQEKEWTRNYI